MVRQRHARGWDLVDDRLSLFDSLFTQVGDPQRMPETITLREYIRCWRFYDHFRSDADAPARQPAMATRTPVL
ncbi:hypothetical protein LZB55_08950, partial [Campylobacter lari]|nr:hypothetical protein [Campylobacter lari]